MDGLFAFPPLMLALAVAALLGPSITNASIAIAIPFIPGFARLVRAEVLSVREEPSSRRRARSVFTLVA